MALSSVINPETITGTKKSNLLGAQKFISGENSLGSGVLGSAANKIVKFQKAGVQPSPIDINNIIKTISTGITNSYNNQAQTINSSVTNIINKSIGNFSKDYQDRIKKVDEAKPTGVLQKVLGLYRDVINFVQFFGKRKFVEGLRDNLKALQKSFTDSFEVAKLIRQVIIKIVKQLSNLPKASPSGGGGINLDVDVPGGGLKKTAPRGLNRRMGGGKMLALGAGALGLGAAGAAATNALSNSDAIQPGSPAPEIPGNLLDGLTAVIDRFSKAIDSLVKGSSGKKTSGSSRGGGGSAGNIEKPKATPGGPAPNLSSSGSEGVIDYAKQKGFSEQFTAGLLTQVSHESGGNPFAYNPDDVGKPSYGSFQFRAERGDSMIKYLESNGIPNAKPIFTNSKDPRRNDKELQKKALSLQIKYFTEDEKDQATAGLRAAQKSTSIEGVHRAFAASERYDGYDNPNSERYRARLADTKTSYKDLNKSGKMRGTSTSPTAQAQAAPTAQAQVTQRVSTVSQPVQQQSQVNYLPIDMSGGGQQTQQQSPGGGGISAPPSPQQNGPTQPFLSPSNPDNFLTLYSRMVYNIVDG